MALLRGPRGRLYCLTGQSIEPYSPAVKERPLSSGLTSSRRTTPRLHPIERTPMPTPLLSHRAPRLWVLGSLFAAWLVAAWLVTPRAQAQQPLSEFIDASDEHSTDVREAIEAARGAGSAVDEARGRLLPSATATGSYTRNEREVVVNLGVDRTAVITPFDQLDARFSLNVPLLDLTAWESFFASEATADAAEARAELARDTVRITVVQTWHSLVASRALVEAAESTLAAAETARQAAAARVEVGVSPPAELARAEAEAARARQSLAEARLGATLAAQNLTVLTGLTPSEVRIALTDDLHPEPSLDTFVAGVEGLPAREAAGHDVRAAERLRDGAWMAFLPTFSGTLSERITNAAGFGPNSVWALSVTATWTLDFIRPFTVETREASLAAARIREEETLLLSEAAIVEAWHRVASLIERAAAAQAALDATTRASEDARARFEAGAGTQLEAILSERDRFSAEVSHIQAIGDLRVARAALRIRAGMDPE